MRTSAGTISGDASPFSMFFQSLLPTFNAQELAPAAVAPAVALAGNAPVAEINDPNAAQRAIVGAIGEAVANVAEGIDSNQSFTELRTSLNSIVDAMRDFLTNVRVPERPNDADVDENESSEDEPNDYLT